MRFPLSLTTSLTGYLVKQKIAGRKRFPLVLMLEPLHACNLTCTGCGRIREYAATIRERMSVEDCLASADECGAPVVSVCGGEPLVYKGIEELVAKLIERKKHVYVCTNAMMLEKKLPGFRPTSRLFFNVHLDGMEATHDLMVEREGCFAAAVAGIKAAVAAGFQVTTNTTVYQETDMNEIGVLWAFLSELGVGGFMVSPAYAYEAVSTTNPSGAERLFMTRDDVHAKFLRRQADAQAVPPCRHAAVSRFPLRRARVGLCRLGQSHAERRRLARAVLPVGRCALQDLRRTGRRHRLVEVRARQRSALRALPDALRFRALGRAGVESPLRRHVEDGRVADDVRSQRRNPKQFKQEDKTRNARRHQWNSSSCSSCHSCFLSMLHLDCVS